MHIQHVLGSTMAHRELGSGAPVVFLHGNPTSSHLWRKVMPAVAYGRRLAPDLIGMGASGKPAIEYTFADHARYLDAWFDALGLEDVVLVGHDWGGALAFDWAARHPGRVRGIAFTEAVVKPMSWAELPEGGRETFRAIKTEGVGEAMILDGEDYFRRGLPATMATPLAEEDVAAYLRPYPTRESRAPLLRWARSLPLGGEPADVVARMEAFGRWAAGPEVPKLLIGFRPGPGAMWTQETIAWCARTMASLEIAEHDAVAGHHTPEDQPLAIAAAVSDWIAKHAG